MAKCVSPYMVKDANGRHVPVPCGRCPSCLLRRAGGWAFRMQVEDVNSDSAMFLTLTYSNDYVPYSKNGLKTLNKKHVQDFMKRFRHYHPNGTKIKYFFCGEYGSKFSRPHYHAIIFNADRLLVEKAWKFGEFFIGSVSGASIGYVLKYMCKPSRVPMYKNDDRLKEFQLMSKGLGSSYITAAAKAYHTASLEERMFVTLPGDIMVSMPRYYKQKIYSPEELGALAGYWEYMALQDEPENEQDVQRKNHKIRSFWKTSQKNRDKL